MRTERLLAGDHEAANDPDGGFTLVEILIVLVVLGILAAIVIFMLSGATTRSARSACSSDARTVALAATAYQTEYPAVAQLTEAQLTAQGSGTLQSWPTGPSGSYAIVIAGDGNGLVGTADANGVTIGANDVLVKVGAQYYDATKSLPDACAAV